MSFAPDHTDVALSKDWYGLIPGICGLTSHASYDYTFRMFGHKTEYLGSEIREVQAEPHWTTTYKGSLSIDRDKRQVVVKLSQHADDGKDYPFELNGRYHYH